jgi:hypothetical protein
MLRAHLEDVHQLAGPASGAAAYGLPTHGHVSTEQLNEHKLNRSRARASKWHLLYEERRPAGFCTRPLHVGMDWSDSLSVQAEGPSGAQAIVGAHETSGGETIP